MLVQKAQRKWETRPLDSWQKAKELRAKFYQNEVTARERGFFLIEAFDSSACAGIDNCHPVFCNPYGASIAAASDEFARQCQAATEVRGYGRDFCGYMQNELGAIFLNRGLLGGEFCPRDFLLASSDGCDMHYKHAQVVTKHFGIPYISQQDWVAYHGEADTERDEARHEYLLAQYLEMIEQLEKITGRKFDDENFIESAKSGFRTQALRTEILMYQQSIPAPLDQKSMYSLFTAVGFARAQQEEAEKYWKMLRDEVKWRVENKIAALATERYRYVEEEPPPWFFLRYYRYLEEYGAICIGSPYTHGYSLRKQPDGTFARDETPLERGVQLNTREDVIRLRLGMGTSREDIECRKAKGGRGGASGSDWQGHSPAHEQYAGLLLNMVEAFHCDGAILPLHRAGIGCQISMRETAAAFLENGIPFMHYETSHPGNRTDFSEARLLDQLDVFMETQGFRKLEVED